MFGNLTGNHFDLARRRKVMIMRRPTGHLAHVLAGSAVALLLSACGQGSTTTAPVESASSAVASGAIASADLCPEGPPARGSLADGRYESDGVVGTVSNQTGAAVWISNQAPKPSMAVEREVTRTPCLLEAGKSAVYSGSDTAVLYISAAPTNRTGTRIGLLDPLAWYPSASVTGFKEPFVNDNYSCGAGYLDAVDFSEGASRDFEATNGAGYTGKVTIVRLPDDEAAANEYTGRTFDTDDWARMDITIFALGSCS